MRQLTLAAALLAVLPASSLAWPAARPKWTKAKPHVEERAGKKVAVAVGKAKDLNAALARVAAEERARAALLKLLQGKAQDASAEGRVAGAQVAEVFNAKGGVTYVRLEVDAP